jgi:hypothetical protein
VGHERRNCAPRNRLSFCHSHCLPTSVTLLTLISVLLCGADPTQDVPRRGAKGLRDAAGLPRQAGRGTLLCISATLVFDICYSVGLLVALCVVTTPVLLLQNRFRYVEIRVFAGWLSITAVRFTAITLPLIQLCIDAHRGVSAAERGQWTGWHALQVQHHVIDTALLVIAG